MWMFIWPPATLPHARDLQVLGRLPVEKGLYIGYTKACGYSIIGVMHLCSSSNYDSLCNMGGKYNYSFFYAGGGGLRTFHHNLILVHLIKMGLGLS